MHVTNRLLLISRSRKGSWHDITSSTLWYLALYIHTTCTHCHDQLRPCNLHVNGPTRAHHSHRATIYNRKVAKLYQQTTCTYLSKSRGSACIAAKRWINTARLSGSRSAREQRTSPSVKVSHYRDDWNIPWTRSFFVAIEQMLINARLSHTCVYKRAKLRTPLQCGLINESMFNEGQLPSSSAFRSYARSFGSRAN